MAAKRDPILDVLPPPFERCDIPAGRVTLEENAGTFEVKPFQMAKYPVTYAQFQVFVEAEDGFHNPEWWAGLAADAEHREQPGEQEWKIVDHPRENVSWYDAVAFCRWLTARVAVGAHSRAPLREVRLPTEWEWQWAAQGPDGREYPWGNELDKNRCNSKKSGIGQTTPVTRYPAGESPFHVMDMSGNVWEWCLNEYGNPGNVDTKGSNMRVRRGGSWVFDQDHARASYRNLFFPYYRCGEFGFRVVVCRPLSL